MSQRKTAKSTDVPGATIPATAKKSRPFWASQKQLRSIGVCTRTKKIDQQVWYDEQIQRLSEPIKSWETVQVRERMYYEKSHVFTDEQKMERKAEFQLEQAPTTSFARHESSEPGHALRLKGPRNEDIAIRITIPLHLIEILETATAILTKVKLDGGEQGRHFTREYALSAIKTEQSSAKETEESLAKETEESSKETDESSAKETEELSKGVEQSSAKEAEEPPRNLPFMTSDWLQDQPEATQWLKAIEPVIVYISDLLQVLYPQQWISTQKLIKGLYRTPCTIAELVDSDGDVEKDACLKWIGQIFSGIAINEDKREGREIHYDDNGAIDWMSLAIPFGEKLQACDLVLWDLKEIIQLSRGDIVFFCGQTVAYSIQKTIPDGAHRDCLDLFTHQGLIDSWRVVYLEEAKRQGKKIRYNSGLHSIKTPRIFEKSNLKKRKFEAEE
ncbi:hypothetical protein EDC01DRAFT_653297 [Geopyxis carbonaria]|nr:hypothetical protein EDC01DRAFT_653297 [Geopyxis carbonaria]